MNRSIEKKNFLSIENIIVSIGAILTISVLIWIGRYIERMDNFKVFAQETNRNFEKIDAKIAAFSEEMKQTSKSEFDTLNKKIDELSLKIEEYHKAKPNNLFDESSLKNKTRD